ncbi:TetR/AcrR family transcriptional regulator [Streptomyces sp. NPDC102360]|uniref:TetR/AcrR family transcriptional regulator n=1 Tax=Streptomyces sp. NPDC102360 TaxID=3366160 RepID=UPI0038122875
MARRGPYAKGVAKREEILNTALEIVARVGYGRTTVRELSLAVGLSQNGLLHYFGSKEQLFVEILRRRDEVDLHANDAGPAPTDYMHDLAEVMGTLLRHNAQVPGLVQLYSQFSSEATDPDHPAHPYFRGRFRTARSEISASLRAQQESGDLSPELDADRLAVIIVALTDGLQAQWMYDAEVDMADHLAYLFSLLGTGAATRRGEPTGEPAHPVDTDRHTRG